MTKKNPADQNLTRKSTCKQRNWTSDATIESEGGGTFESMFKNFRNNNSEEGKQMFVANHKAYHSEDVYVHGQK